MKKRMLGLAVGLAAMAFTQMAPAHAGSATKNYVGGGVMGVGTVSGAEVENTKVGGVRFDGVSGTRLNLTVADASGMGVAANVSFRKPADPLNPQGSFEQISSTRLCGTKLTSAVIPSGTTFVVVFMYAAYPETTATTGSGCPAGKVGPATTGSVAATWS